MHLDSVSGNHLELVRVAKSLDTLSYLCDHPSVDFDRDEFLSPLEKGGCQVTRARADF